MLMRLALHLKLSCLYRTRLYDSDLHIGPRRCPLIPTSSSSHCRGLANFEREI